MKPPLFSPPIVCRGIERIVWLYKINSSDLSLYWTVQSNLDNHEPLIIMILLTLGTSLCKKKKKQKNKKKNKNKNKNKTKQNKTKNNISILYIDYYLINKLLDIKVLQLIYLPIAIQLTNPWILRFYMWYLYCIFCYENI